MRLWLQIAGFYTCVGKGTDLFATAGDATAGEQGRSEQGRVGRVAGSK